MIEIKNLEKQFDGKAALKNINLKVSKGENLVIIGPSGSGKSTLLRTMNLLEKADSGSVFFENEEIDSDKTDLNLFRQKIAMVFQHFNLFPHLTVLENIKLAPLKLKLLNEETATKKALLLLEQVGLVSKKDKYPSTLSGGEKQRIAIVRALIMEPKVFLFDEPTSALDPEMVGEVLDLMSELASKNTTMVVVSHEMNFAKELASRVIFMADGEILEENNAKDFFENPQHPRLQDFLSKVL